MFNFCCVHQNGYIEYIELANITNYIKNYCKTHNKSLGSSYLNFHQNTDHLISLQEYDNKCVIIKEKTKWNLVEKQINHVETGWLYSNIIKKIDIVVLLSFHIMNNTKIPYTNDVIDIIEQGNFEKILELSNIDPSTIYGKHLDMLFSKCTNIAIIKHFIDKYQNIEYIDENNKKITNYIMENPSEITIESFKYIVSKGINLDHTYPDGHKLIHSLFILYESSFHHKLFYQNLFEYVVQLNIDLFSTISGGISILHLVCAYGSIPMVKLLLNRYLESHSLSDVINNQTDNGDTPLHYVCKYNPDILLISLLLDSGANKYIINNEGDMPFNCINVNTK